MYARASEDANLMQSGKCGHDPRTQCGAGDDNGDEGGGRGDDDGDGGVGSGS